MDFSLTGRQNEVLDAAREFVQCMEVAPPSELGPPNGIGPLIREIGPTGLLAVGLPSELGGDGTDYLSIVLLLEALAEAHPLLALRVATHRLQCMEHLLRFGAPRQKSEWLPRLASGELLGSWVPEMGPGASHGRLEPRLLATQAAPGWTLDGTESFVVGTAEADLFVVLAKLESGRLIAFLLPRQNQGFRSRAQAAAASFGQDAMGILLFEGCEVEAQWQLGTLLADEDLRCLMSCRRLGLAAVAMGLAQRALDAARTGLVAGPGKSAQPLEWLVANAATDLDSARLLSYEAARVLDGGDDAVAETAAAKLLGVRAALGAAQAAAEIRGLEIYLEDSPASLIWAQAKQCQLRGGSDDLLRLEIARSLLGV